MLLEVLKRWKILAASALFLILHGPSFNPACLSLFWRFDTPSNSNSFSLYLPQTNFQTFHKFPDTASLTQPKIDLHTSEN